MTGRFAMKTSPEYGVWFRQFAAKLNATESAVMREALRRLAEAKKFRPPPIR
jgi:hypothetical protein